MSFLIKTLYHSLFNIKYHKRLKKMPGFSLEPTQKQSPFLINNENAKMNRINPSTDETPLTASELEALKDPSFQSFFKNVLEQPHLANQLQSLIATEKDPVQQQ